MPETQASLTALITAYARAHHSQYDSPKIFDDFLAPQLFTVEEHAYFSQNLAKSLEFFDPEFAESNPDQSTALGRVMQIQNGPVTLSRSRYTEDCLEDAINNGITQYIILGAGMETFAFRKPELLQQLQVFEVDHPATQIFKQGRLNKLGWDYPAGLHFVPVDFTKDNLEKALKEVPSYNPRKSSFISWLGVTYYLTREIIFKTLRTITSIAATGSIIVFDYMDADAFIPERAAKRIQLMQEVVRQVGEPMKTGFEPAVLSEDLKNIGLQLCEELDPSEIESRYFQGRKDDYHAAEHVHFARVAVNSNLPTK